MDRTEFDGLHPAPNQDGVESLYKFKAFDEKKPQRLTEIFEHSLLYIPIIDQLNDPWEGQSNVEPPATQKEIAAAKQRIAMTARQNGLSEEEAIKNAENFLSDPGRLVEVVKAAVKNSTRNIRIISFAAERDNVLLWSHYANSHQGICIEFSSETILYKLAHRVNYQSDYPSFIYPHDQYEGLNTIVTKSTDWLYEREYRTFDVPGSASQLRLEDGKFRLADAAISRVYFGARMPQEHQDQIIESIQRGPFTPELFKATLRTDAYALNYIQIE